MFNQANNINILEGESPTLSKINFPVSQTFNPLIHFPIHRLVLELFKRYKIDEDMQRRN